MQYIDENMKCYCTAYNPHQNLAGNNSGSRKGTGEFKDYMNSNRELKKGHVIGD
jgi:hypothetical protein